MLGVSAGEIALLVAAVMVAASRPASSPACSASAAAPSSCRAVRDFPHPRRAGGGAHAALRRHLDAIIIPTTIRSYITHNAKGMVLSDVMRAWAVPAVLGVAAGSVIAYSHRALCSRWCSW